jgi:hypothetical protein
MRLHTNKISFFFEKHTRAWTNIPYLWLMRVHRSFSKSECYFIVWTNNTKLRKLWKVIRGDCIACMHACLRFCVQHGSGKWQVATTLFVLTSHQQSVVSAVKCVTRFCQKRSRPHAFYFAKIYTFTIMYVIPFSWTYIYSSSSMVIFVQCRR